METGHACTRSAIVTYALSSDVCVYVCLTETRGGLRNTHTHTHTHIDSCSLFLFTTACDIAFLLWPLSRYNHRPQRLSLNSCAGGGYRIVMDSGFFFAARLAISAHVDHSVRLACVLALLSRLWPFAAPLPPTFGIRARQCLSVMTTIRALGHPSESLAPTDTQSNSKPASFTAATTTASAGFAVCASFTRHCWGVCTAAFTSATFIRRCHDESVPE